MMRSLLISTTILMAGTDMAMAAQGDWLVRLRGIVVAPTENSSAVTGIPGSEVGVENAVVPELDFTYFLTDNIAAELILATSPHDIAGEGSIAGLDEIAEVMVLPPTLTLQYHFLPNGDFIRPYAGVGINYSIFYSQDSTASLENALGGATDVDLDDSVGVAFQLGADFPINDRWFLNADVKYIQIDTEATLTTGSDVRTVEVDLDPIVAGVGVGFRF